MKILMYGPPQGHNIRLYLEFFEKYKDKYELTYLYWGKPKYPFRQIFKSIHYISFRNIPSFFLLLISRLKKYDLIWIHNWTPWYIILFTIWCKSGKTKINYSVWSEPIPRLATTNTIKGAIYRYIFRKCDFVQCLWDGLKLIIDSDVSEVNTVVLPWGLAPDYFKRTDTASLNKETVHFINQLPENKVKFFFPKSISYASRHDLIIEAAKRLKDRSILNFVVYLWIGNYVKKQLFEQLTQQIRAQNVEDCVKFVEHSFLPFQDIICIWKTMDCGLQIASHDALSTSIMEPMYFKKELIASDILPYRLLESKFQIHLGLIENKVKPLADRMEQIIRGKGASDEELARRCQVISNNFNFEQNVFRMVNHFSHN